MHAYLLTSEDKNKLYIEAQKFAESKSKRVLEFSIQKITEVRQLNKFLSLTTTEPTSILINDIDTASIASLNAFLKNLEEPQENINFILTAASEYKVISTIVSRCLVIKLKYEKSNSKNPIVENFLNASIGQKFKICDSIRKREDAQAFIENLVFYLHKVLLEGKEKLIAAKTLRLANETLQALNANGNVNLQLSNFIIKSGSF